MSQLDASYSADDFEDSGAAGYDDDFEDQNASGEPPSSQAASAAAAGQEAAQAAGESSFDEFEATGDAAGSSAALAEESGGQGGDDEFEATGDAAGASAALAEESGGYGDDDEFEATGDAAGSSAALAEESGDQGGESYALDEFEHAADAAAPTSPGAASLGPEEGRADAAESYDLDEFDSGVDASAVADGGEPAGKAAAGEGGDVAAEESYETDAAEHSADTPPAPALDAEEPVVERAVATAEAAEEPNDQGGEGFDMDEENPSSAEAGADAQNPESNPSSAVLHESDDLPVQEPVKEPTGANGEADAANELELAADATACHASPSGEVPTSDDPAVPAAAPSKVESPPPAATAATSKPVAKPSPAPRATTEKKKVEAPPAATGATDKPVARKSPAPRDAGERKIVRRYRGPSVSESEATGTSQGTRPVPGGRVRANAGGEASQSRTREDDQLLLTFTDEADVPFAAATVPSRSASTPAILPAELEHDAALQQMARRPHRQVSVTYSCRQPSGRSSSSSGQRNKAPAKALYKEWDDRHHIVPGENGMLPKRLRSYFSKPVPAPEPGDGKLQIMKSPISADAEMSSTPARHVHGGVMLDRDGQPRPWNNRWSAGTHTCGDIFHSLHKPSFGRGAGLFDQAPSQRWRRHMDVEVAPGVWKPIAMKKPPRFPPLGA